MSAHVGEQYTGEAREKTSQDHSSQTHGDFYSPNAEDKSQGVLKAEAARAVMGWKLWMCYIGIALTAYMYGLDNNTFYAWAQAAAQAQGNYPLYTTISTIQGVIIAVGKFPIAKLSDIFGRAQGYAVSLVCYVIGFIIVASSQRFSDLCGGTVLYAFGNSGVQIMQNIVVADAVNTRWRGLANGLLSLPYVINFAIAPMIVAQLTPQWRWGAGLFCICLPVAIAPVILALALSQRQAKKEGKVAPHPYTQMSLGKAVMAFVNDIDLGGLFLLCAGFLLILIPLNIYVKAASGWNTGYIIAMVVVGGVLLIALGLFEWLVAPEPIFKKRFIANKDVMLPAIIGFFDFASFYLSWTSAFYFVMILKGWNIEDATYFSNAQSLSLTVFGIMIGAINILTKRIKWTMVVGAAIRMLGLGLMIAYRHAGVSTAQLVIPQILQGLGGGILGINLVVSAQIAVPHQDVALVSAFVLLLTEMGGAVGSSILASIQAQTIPSTLARLLPNDLAAQTAIFSSPFTAIYTYPIGSVERTAMIEAWSNYMRTALIVGIVLSAIPLLFSFLLSERRLGKGQNCVEYKPDGTPVDLPQEQLK